jgi:hypothetical protein
MNIKQRVEALEKTKTKTTPGTKDNLSDEMHQRSIQCLYEAMTEEEAGEGAEREEGINSMIKVLSNL